MNLADRLERLMSRSRPALRLTRETTIMIEMTQEQYDNVYAEVLSQLEDRYPDLTIEEVGEIVTENLLRTITIIQED